MDAFLTHPVSNGMKHLNIKIFGEVQGVSFRFYARETARKLKLVGFIRNEADDSLYAEAEGGESALAEFVNWCKQGPAYAEVKKVEIAEGALKNFSEFTIEND